MKKYALITGGSSGIGEEFARQLANEGKSLILVARSKSKLKEVSKNLSDIHKIDVHTLPLDLSHLNSAEKVFQYCDDNKLKVDLLINNAGTGLIEDFSENDPDKIEEMLLLNVFTLTKLCHLFLPQLKKSFGTILNVASEAAFQPQPRMAVYAATKAYVLSFTESIREENKNKNVKISALCPGPTYTQFFEKAGTTSNVMRFKFRKPEQVVKIALKGIKKNKGVILVGFENKMVVFLNRFSPRALLPKISKKMVKK